MAAWVRLDFIPLQERPCEICWEVHHGYQGAINSSSGQPRSTSGAIPAPTRAAVAPLFAQAADS